MSLMFIKRVFCLFGCFFVCLFYKPQSATCPEAKIAMHIINIFQFSASLFLLSKFSHRPYNILGKKSSISDVISFNSAVSTPHKSDTGSYLEAMQLNAQQITSFYGNTPQGEEPHRKK